MKKAFTMVEMVFVIVILGILAGVALPKLWATRDDAEIAKALTAYETVIKDLTTYYAANGEMTDNISKATNVDLREWGNERQKANETAGTLFIKGKECLAFNQRMVNSVHNGAKHEGFYTMNPIPNLGIKEGDAVLFIHKNSRNNDPICKKIAEKLGLPQNDNSTGNYIKLGS